MMKGKNLSNAFWAEAINTTIYLKNRSPTRCLDNVTPFEALYGSKPAVNNLKVLGVRIFHIFQRRIGGNWMLNPLNVFSLGTVLNLKHTNYLIMLLTKYLQVEMYFSMSRKQKIMMTTVMRNGRDFLMKELKKRSSSSPHSSNHPCSDKKNHPCKDSSSSSKKNSVIWTIPAVTVHLQVKTDLHKVGRKIIS
jgi:hypothetical protein